MKQLSRSYLWWPGLDADITDIVQKCETCQINRPNPSKAPLHPWEFPVRPASEVTIAKLSVIFVTFGLPEQLVSDNASGFTSTEFKRFLSVNGVRQVLVSPYHPSSNGLAERALWIFKNTVKKLEGPMEVSISKFYSSTGSLPRQPLVSPQLSS